MHAQWNPDPDSLLCKNYSLVNCPLQFASKIIMMSQFMQDKVLIVFANKLLQIIIKCQRDVSHLELVSVVTSYNQLAYFLLKCKDF